MMKASSLQRNNMLIAVAAGVSLLVVGIAVIFALAAGPVASVEAENATGANTIDDSLASNSKALLFGANPDPDPGGGGGGGGGVGDINGVPAITRDGAKLMRAGQQFKFAGVNADGWGLNDCRRDIEGPNMTDENIDTFFRDLTPHSVTRIWTYDGAGNIELMDRLVAAAEKYGQYLSPAFFDGNDGGSQCGSQPHGDVGASVEHIRPLIERYSKTKGSRPTNVIAFWEVSNEIGGSDNKDWYHGVAAGMKEMDPTTLVGTGTSPYNPISGQEVADVHDSPNIDLISIHEYDNGCNVSHQADKAIEASAILNKPWYSGESGGSYEGGGDYEGGPGMGDCLQREWRAYLDEPSCAGMQYWDFKMLTGASGDTMTLMEPNILWDAAKSFRHEYSGA